MKRGDLGKEDIRRENFVIRVHGIKRKRCRAKEIKQADWNKWPLEHDDEEYMYSTRQSMSLKQSNLLDV